MITARSSIKRQVRYSNLTNIELILDASGLATNTTNSYGQVDASDVIVALNSVAPGPTGKDFSVIGSGVTFNPATKSIAYNGSGRLRSTGAASVYDFMSYNAAGYTSIKWTCFMVCKIGNVVKPATASYALIGNNGTSSVSKGMAINYANNTTNEDTITASNTRGTSGQFLGRVTVPGGAPSNQYCVIVAQFDGSAASNVRMRLYINDQAMLNIEQLQNNNTPVTTPTYALEIGGGGNSVLPMIGNIKEVILTSDAPGYNTVIPIIRQLMNKHNIVRSRSTDYLNTSLVPEIFDQSIGTAGLEYHLSAIISQNPVDRNEGFSAYSEGGGHVYYANKKLVGRKSLYKFAPFASILASQVDIYDPAGADSVQDCGGGYDQNGVFHIFADVANGSTAGTMVGVRHIYSSDLATWTNTDITSVLPSDGLAAWRVYGNMIHVGGVWLKPYYKYTDQGDVTNSANYVFRSTDGVNWSTVTVRSSGATYINEASVFWCGGNNVGYLARNDATGEWSISMSTDLGATWGAFSDIAFGETVASANPAMVKSFTHNGVLLNVAYITNRNNDNAFAIYGKASDIVANPVTGWNLNTKIMWWKTALAPYHYHYGDVAHLDDTIKAVGAYIYDQWPATGTGTVSRVNYTIMPTWHISKIETELGI